GLTGLVSLIGCSFLSEVERPSILRTGLPVAPSLSYRLATRPLGSRPPPQRAGAERLRALAQPTPSSRRPLSRGSRPHIRPTLRAAKGRLRASNFRPGAAARAILRRVRPALFSR